MVQPSRRQILSALYAGGSALLAGCTAGPRESNDTNETSTTTVEDGETTPPGSHQSDPDFPEETTSNACPPFDGADRVICYEAVDPEEIPLVLVPETQSVQPIEPTKFTLRNQSGQRFQTNFYHWQLYKRVDGDWYYITPQFWPEPMMTLEASEEHTWTVTAATGRVSDGNPIEHAEGTESLTVAGLGGGHYTFGTNGFFAAGSHEESIALAAGFELNADPLQLTPTETIGETEWDGETLVARSTRELPDGEADKFDTFVLERTDGSETDAKRVIVEQVVRDDQVRNAIALSRKHDAERVRLEWFSRSPTLFRLHDAPTYEFRGDHYRVTVRDGGSS